VKRLLVALAVLVVVAAAVLVPLPVAVVSPGVGLSVTDSIELVDVDVEPPEGEYLLTTVRVGRPSTVGAVAAMIDPETDLVPLRALIPEGVDFEEFRREQERLFAEMSEVAAAVALRAAGHHVVIEGKGARVMGVLAGAPADGVLQRGDVVVAADGAPVAFASDLVALVGERDAGDELALSVERGGEVVEVVVEVAVVGELGRTGLGVALRSKERVIDLPFEVRVTAEEIGGPSGGLMKSLAIYDLVTPGDLTDGRLIAGTGSVDAAGRVGAVGGITQKVAAAIDEGAEIFLVPTAEADLAVAAAGDAITVVPVDTFDEALAALG
jgi:PDZ domain-containing protein